MDDESEVYFLANPHSPHVRHWEKVLLEAGYAPVVFCIRTKLKTPVLLNDVRYVGPKFFRHIPQSVNYLVSGLYLRLFGKSRFYHAHNTSGYGVMALLSGRAYGVTTYGSEIYDAPRRSAGYRKLVHKVLKQSDFITSTSPQMTNVLVEYFEVSRKKIREFSLGVDEVFLYSPEARADVRSHWGVTSAERIWCVNRRIHPVYRTLELVIAFNQYVEQGGRGILVLLEGDSNQQYLQRVLLEASKSKKIIVVRGFLSQPCLRDLLCGADYTISIPWSDQMSSSILEGMACRTLPILNNLSAYGSIRDVSHTISLTGDVVQVLLSMFHDTYSLNNLDGRKETVYSFFGENYTQERAMKEVKSLYERVIS